MTRQSLQPITITRSSPISWPDPSLYHIWLNCRLTQQNAEVPFPSRRCEEPIVQHSRKIIINSLQAIWLIKTSKTDQARGRSERRAGWFGDHAMVPFQSCSSEGGRWRKYKKMVLFHQPIEDEERARIADRSTAKPWSPHQTLIWIRSKGDKKEPWDKDTWTASMQKKGEKTLKPII